MRVGGSGRIGQHLGASILDKIPFEKKKHKKSDYSNNGLISNSQAWFCNEKRPSISGICMLELLSPDLLAQSPYPATTAAIAEPVKKAGRRPAVDLNKAPDKKAAEIWL